MAKIHIITFGCAVNISDSELMAGLLESVGHEIVNSIDNSDLVIINSCTVKNMAESKFFRTIKSVEEKKKKIILAGCVPQADSTLVNDKLLGYSILGTKNLNHIVSLVEETLFGKSIRLIDGNDRNIHLNLPKVSKNPVVSIIPISEGCLGNCSYCKTKYARGDLVSYDISEIKDQFLSDLKKGCKEFFLTSQDCGAYGLDNNTNIIKLLKSLLEVDGDYKIRIGMSNPNHIMTYVDDLIVLFKNYEKNLFQFIHIPIQSGNDRILKLMNRYYSREDFLSIIRKLRKNIPNITIATDIICGFPSETEDEFNDSLNLVKQAELDIVNISRFWPRPGTSAATMSDQLSGTITNERSRKLVEIFKTVAIKRNEYWKDWSGDVIIEEKGNIIKDKDGKSIQSWKSRNKSYKQIILKGNYKPGQVIKVKIISFNEHYLHGEEVK